MSRGLPACERLGGGHCHDASFRFQSCALRTALHRSRYKSLSILLTTDTDTQLHLLVIVLMQKLGLVGV